MRSIFQRIWRLVWPAETGGAGLREGAEGFLLSLRTSDRCRLQQVMRMYARYRRAFPGVAEISADAALELTAGGLVVFVDIRDAAEQEVSMLPGAITGEELLADPERFADRPLVAYCTVGYRSGKFVQRYSDRFNRLQNLEGGILAWLHAGGQVYHRNLPTRRVHVYGARWTLQPAAYEPVYDGAAPQKV